MHEWELDLMVLTLNPPTELSSRCGMSGYTEWSVQTHPDDCRTINTRGDKVKKYKTKIYTKE